MATLSDSVEAYTKPISGFSNLAEQNAFFAIVVAGAFAGFFLIKWLLKEIKDGRVQTNGVMEKLNLSIVEYTKAITELTIEIRNQRIHK